MTKKNEYKYKISGEISYVYLEKNDKVHTVILDTKHLNRFLNHKYKWNAFFDKYTKSFYVKSTVHLGKGKYKNLYLHRFLLNIEDRRIHVDHENHNRLDNREKNLRSSTHSDNNKSRKSKNSNNKSGYRNVSFIRGFYKIQIQIEGKNTMLPEKFTDVDEAGRFAEKMRKKYYGKYAGKN